MKYRVKDGARNTMNDKRVPAAGSVIFWDGTSVDEDGDVYVASPDPRDYLPLWVMPMYLEPVPVDEMPTSAKAEVSETTRVITEKEIVLRLTDGEAFALFEYLSNTAPEDAPGLDDVFNALDSVLRDA